MIDSVPLIQNANDVQQINASIIAMKKASRELDEKIAKLNSLNSELDKKIALLDSGLNKEIEDRKEAINSLDVASVGGSGKYISAISETDGKISATASDITSTVSSGNSQPVTSGGVYTKLNTGDFLSSGLVKTYDIEKTISSYNTWVDLITRAEVVNGLYAFEIILTDNSIWWGETLSFVMYFYNNRTNSSNSSPIYFNQAGHANNDGVVQLRFKRTGGQSGQLSAIQINLNKGSENGVIVTSRLFRIA